jgi:two-component system chemotaxis response regulator CheY
MRILIADDQRSVGTSLAELVRSCNHDIVAVVGSGVEAIHAYSLHRPDVVLMDYWMPKLNGATACRNIVAKDPTARVILVSAWSPAKGIVGDSGALALLPKPVDLDRLAAALDDAALALPYIERAPTFPASAPS